jgi:prepilin-type N-terminal cleavage/methylation domain-containing protein
MTPAKTKRKLNLQDPRIFQGSGFTLIEICITIVVISIIVGLAIASLGNSKSQTEAKKREATITSIEMAKTRYVLESPNNLTGLETQLEHIAPYMLVKGKTPSNLTSLVEGTGKSDSDLDLGTYQDVVAHFTNGVGIPAIPTAPTPITMPSISNITANNATFTWGYDTNAVGYQYQFGGGTNWGATPVSYNSSNPPGGLSFVGLTPTTTYFIRVRWTNGTNLGSWATNFFTTLP